MRRGNDWRSAFDTDRVKHKGWFGISLNGYRNRRLELTLGFSSQFLGTVCGGRKKEQRLLGEAAGRSVLAG